MFRARGERDVLAALAEKGIRILQEDHGKRIYLDTENILGMNIELVPSG